MSCVDGWGVSWLGAGAWLGAAWLSSPPLSPSWYSVSWESLYGTDVIIIFLDEPIRGLRSFLFLLLSFPDPSILTM